MKCKKITNYKKMYINQDFLFDNSLEIYDPQKNNVIYKFENQQEKLSMIRYLFLANYHLIDIADGYWYNNNTYRYINVSNMKEFSEYIKNHSYFDQIPSMIKKIKKTFPVCDHYLETGRPKLLSKSTKMTIEIDHICNICLDNNYKIKKMVSYPDKKLEYYLDEMFDLFKQSDNLPYLPDEIVLNIFKFLKEEDFISEEERIILNIYANHYNKS